MPSTGIILVAIVVLVVVACISLAAMYNRLVVLANRYRNAYAQIDVQLKRRHDLIPNLVETAKGYMAHERKTLEAVIAARTAAVNADAQAAAAPQNVAAVLAAVGAENALVGMLRQFFALAEAYPDLKANQTMAQLMEELSSTENRIAFARQAYNDTVMLYNTARQTFPTSMMAGSFGFGPAQLFEIEDSRQREVVKVQMS